DFPRRHRRFPGRLHHLDEESEAYREDQPSDRSDDAEEGAFDTEEPDHTGLFQTEGAQGADLLGPLYHGHSDGVQYRHCDDSCDDRKYETENNVEHAFGSKVQFGYVVPGNYLPLRFRKSL